MELPEGDFFYFEIIGMTVITNEGLELGTVADIIRTGANDVFEVKSNDSTTLIPDIPEVVLSVDRESNIITIDPIPGLLNS